MISKAPWKWIPLGILLAQCFTAFSQPPHFDRYGVILDRKPFGDETLPEPPVPDNPALQVPPEKSFTAKFKIVAVTRNSAGVVQVGLVDLKSNRSTLLRIGDTIEGVEVVEADYVNEKARLRRDPEDYWVSMSGGSNRFELVKKEAPEKVVASQPPAPVVSGAGGKSMKTAGRRSSYAERRQSREEARIRAELERLQALEAKRISASKTNAPATSVASVRATKAKAKEPGTVSAASKALMDMLGQMEDSEMTPEEINAYLQEYQKELIRAGQTPLPIPLTPETDQALVEEGVLPAQ